MFTISTHDNNIKICRSGHYLLLRLPEPVFVFCSFLMTLNRFGLAIIISISKILVKKSIDPKLNLPLSRRLSFLQCSFSCSIGQLIFVVFLSFLFLFSSSEEEEGDRVRFLDATRSTRFLPSLSSSEEEEGDRLRFLDETRSTRSTR